MLGAPEGNACRTTMKRLGLPGRPGQHRLFRGDTLSGFEMMIAATITKSGSRAKSGREAADVAQRICC
jgi:hypothetical protein